MDRLRVRIKDKRTCALVKAFLKSGILTELGDREETRTGTPQGGILSPLMANIALSVLDDHFDQKWRQEMGTPYQRKKRRRRGQGNYQLIRYADDFVLMVTGRPAPCRGAARGSDSRAGSCGAAAGTGEDPGGPHR